MGDRPDWARYGARPPNQFEKVGDPTRWGAADRTILVDNSIQQSTQQVLQLTTRDAYARPWSVIGVLTMPVSIWNTAQMISSILVTTGVGQVQLLQEIALWIGTGSAGGPGGLCYQQDSANGGVFLRTENFFMPNVAGLQIAYHSKPFAIIGGLVGQSIQIRARHGVIAGGADLPAPILLSLVATPYAAGEGL